MTTLIHFLVLLITAVTAVLTTDYCDPQLCDDSPHIACGHDGAFADGCVDPVQLELTKDIRDLIVDAHNTLRNRVAGGTAEFEPACRMATMQWDDELAELAELNTKQCEMKHDNCHKTDAFRVTGQNLAWRTYHDLNVTNLALTSVNMWSDEYENTKMAHINEYPNYYRGPTIGHFTVMVEDRNIRVGCAAATYIDSGNKAFLFTCNYARTNVLGARVYNSCPLAASECETGTNEQYHSLCSIAEEYDVN